MPSLLCRHKRALPPARLGPPPLLSAPLLLPRSAFAMANATVSVDTLLATYPGRVDVVAIQFPDPHFKVGKVRAVRVKTATDGRKPGPRSASCRARGCGLDNTPLTRQHTPHYLF